jgi:2-polyprenyl-6-methoxyphenol hydroxylase-like FAD-dependent oxidoreductase
VRRYDAIVVGAGPAGSSLALRLGRAGRRCLLVDGASFPREKVCGEGIMPSGVAELERLGVLERLQESQRFHGIRYRLPDGTAAEGRFPDGLYALGVRRRELDARLLEAARAEPTVEVRLGAWVRELTPARTGEPEIRLRLEGEELAASLLVGADGCRSTVRRLAGLEARPPRRRRFGVRGHFALAPGEQPLVEVYVGDGFELYQTPVGPETTSVALLLEEERLASLQGRLEEGLRELLRGAAPADERYGALAEAPLLSKVAALGPLAQQATVAHGERLILVGDAAGALDPITGEGVALGLVTSAAAAGLLEGCFRDGAFGARRLAAWTRERKRLVRPLLGLTQVVLHLSRSPRRAQRAIRNLVRAPDTFDRLVAVAAGAAPLRSLSLRDGFALALGV